MIVNLRPAARGEHYEVTCLDSAQLNRPHERQYIALHKKGKSFFCIALNHGVRRTETGHSPLIWFNFLATPPTYF
jgi:hypothetical protein